MDTKTESNFHKDFQKLMDEYVHRVYDYTQGFPKEELYGLTSQLRRSALSVPLNYIEGYARGGKAEFRNFVKIAYGSLKESKYIIHFSYKRNYLKEEHYDELMELAERIGKMLWGILSKLK